MSDWRPMSTAPRDGTTILILTPTGIVSGWRLEGAWERRFDGEEYHSAVWCCLDDAVALDIEECPEGDGGDVSDALFWMPLPELPEGYDDAWAKARGAS